MWDSTYQYHVLGGQAMLRAVQIQDGRVRTVMFTNGLDGQALRRDETDKVFSTGDPHEAFYRFGGKQMGLVGNNGSGLGGWMTDSSYSDSIRLRTAASEGTGAFDNGSPTPKTQVDFDGGVGAITTYAQGSGGGRLYGARRGDDPSKAEESSRIGRRFPLSLPVTAREDGD